MKPRNKEVNIFNMSLLDILCGALGAFCFMMLVLFQYWKPEGPETRQVKVDTAQMEQKIQNLLKQMKNMSNLPPEAAARMKQLEEDFGRLQQMTQQLKAQLQQAQAQMQAHKRQAEEANKELQKFKNRNPVTIVMTTMTAAHDVDLYVQDSKMEPADAAKVQGVRWNGDVLFNAIEGPNSDVWMMRDAPPGVYKVYYKFLDRKGNANAARVEGYYLHNSTIVRLPRIEMTQDHRVAFVGSIQVKPDMSSAFQPAPEYVESYRQMLELMRRNQPQAGAAKKQ